MSIEYAQRRAWHRHRSELGLSEGNLRVASHPAFGLMEEPSCVVALLPPDPLAPLLDFDAVTSSVIPQQFEGRTSRFGDASLSEVVSTGSHMLRVARDVGKPFRSLAGVARHGGVVAGAGPAATYQHAGLRVIRLDALTSTVRVALAAQEGVHRLRAAKQLASGPFELTVALPGASGSLLGGYASGWNDLDDELDSPPACQDANAMIRVEIAAVPAEREAVGRLLTQIMGRIVNLFGTDEPLYAPRNNISAGVTHDY